MKPCLRTSQWRSTLESFNIDRDKKYIIPFIKDSMKYTDEITLFASPWSPPDYMKDNYDVLHGGKLLDEYKDVWAHYYVKYIKAFREEGINISAITVQNEPMATQPWESCTYTASEEADFAENEDAIVSRIAKMLEQAFQNMPLAVTD